MTEKIKIKLTVLFLSLLILLALGLSIFFAVREEGTGAGGQSSEQNGDGEQDEGNASFPVRDVSDKLFFTLNEEETAYSVTDMDSTAEGSVTIPSTYKGFPVTGIDEFAFEGCDSLLAITIPESITSIGEGAFRNCSSLVWISYNAIAVEDMISGSNVFYNAGSYYNGITIVFGENVTSIPSYLFYISDLLNRPNLNKVVGCENVKNIGAYAFSNCGRLMSVEIGSKIDRIGDGAFLYCSALTEIMLPESVTSIGEMAFFGCQKLVKVTIPKNVTIIGGSAFSGCSNLTEIIYNATAVVINSVSRGGVFSNAGINSDGITVTFGDSVNNIPAYLFHESNEPYSPNIKNVIIGSNVTSIGEYAFYGCNNLRSVIFGDSVKNIGTCAFYGCSYLEEITIPSNVVNIGKAAFQYCGYLTNVAFENTEGWKYSDSESMISGLELSSDALANSKTAAEYLTLVYNDYYWFRI